MDIEKVMDRKKVAHSIHEILDIGVGLLKKDKLNQDDHAKLKALRTMGSHVNAAVLMIQQETAQQRVAVIAERMKQLGYSLPKQLE
jgi:hypothetical protein